MKEEEIINSNMQGGRRTYIVNLANEVMDAIDDILGSAHKSPTGEDMIDVLSLASVFLLSNQIKLSCNSKNTMQSVLKSTIWALGSRIRYYSEPLLEDEKVWDEYFGKPEEGGDDGKEEA